VPHKGADLFHFDGPVLFLKTEKRRFTFYSATSSEKSTRRVFLFYELFNYFRF